MIAEIYIESAKNIRNEFLRLSKKLDSYQKESAELVIYLEDVSKELLEYSEKNVSKIKSKADIATVGEHIIKKINEIEAREQTLLSLVKPINDKIDKLRKEETILFDQVKEKYPKLSEQQIIEEIHSHL
jgi:siroheme synthase